MMSNKYKTAMCKHFEQTGQCHMGAKCHFAHGQQELRSLNDPVPTGVTPLNSAPKQFRPNVQKPGFSNPTGAGNYKTAKCKYFEKGSCKFADSCSFAHGDEDLRAGSGYPGPQRSPAGGQSNMMPSMMETNIQSQVAQQQVAALGQSLEAYHAQDELIEEIRRAIELNQKGDNQGGASILYGIMNRQDKSKEDIENYQNFTEKIQALGNQLYQQLQMQQYSQMSAQQMDPTQMGGYGGGYNSYKPNSYGQKSYQKEGGNNYYQQSHGGNEAQGGQYGGQGGYGQHNYGGGYQGGYGQYQQ